GNPAACGYCEHPPRVLRSGPWGGVVRCEGGGCGTRQGCVHCEPSRADGGPEPAGGAPGCGARATGRASAAPACATAMAKPVQQSHARDPDRPTRGSDVERLDGTGAV